MTRRPPSPPTKREKDAWTDFYNVRADRVAPAPYVAPKLRVRRALPGESEAEILRAIMKLLKYHPKVVRVWRQNSMVAKFVGEDGTVRHVRANTARGMSDIAGILKSGRSIFIEVKTATGRVEEHQRRFLSDMTKAGAVAFVARDVETVLRVLENLK